MLFVRPKPHRSRNVALRREYSHLAREVWQLNGALVERVRGIQPEGLGLQLRWLESGGD